MQRWHPDDFTDSSTIRQAVAGSWSRRFRRAVP
jgi:hypothetical protein